MKKEISNDMASYVLSMLADLAEKLGYGEITLEELSRFLKRKNPFEDPRALTTILAD